MGVFQENGVSRETLKPSEGARVAPGRQLGRFLAHVGFQGGVGGQNMVANNDQNLPLQGCFILMPDSNQAMIL